MNFTPNNLYHIYNRGNNSQPIFFERGNYLYFLTKIRTHISPLVDILAYCLMPNHFHFLIYVPESYQPEYSPGDLESPGEYNANTEIIKAIAVILRSYTRAINKQHNRTGSLFQEGTKAKLIDQENYGLTCFHYIHQNPITAGLVSNMQDWEFSSYRDYAGLRNGTLPNRMLAYDLLDIPLDPKLFIKESEEVIVDPSEFDFSTYKVD